VATQRDKSIYGQIGTRIAEARRLRQPLFRQEQLAEAVGLSRTALVNIEKGRHRIQIDTLYAIAHALGIKLADLLPPPAEAAAPGSLPPSLARKLKPEEKQRVRNLLARSGGNNADS
jgi:transcriptional regulator with XRE-family HTH domain